MKSPPKFLTMLAAVCMFAVSLFTPACASTDPGGGSDKPGLSFDLLNGVCVESSHGDVCYSPLTKTWTVNSQSVTAVRGPDGAIRLTDRNGVTLVYQDGKVTGPFGPAPPPPK